MPEEDQVQKLPAREQLIQLPPKEEWAFCGARFCEAAGIPAEAVTGLDGGMISVKRGEGEPDLKLVRELHEAQRPAAEAKVSVSVLQALDAGVATQAQVQGALARLLRRAGLG